MTRARTRGWTVAAFLCGAALAGCGGSEPAARPTADQPPPGARTRGAVTDAQSLGEMIAMNEGEIAEAQAALESTRSEAVRGFAAMMADDHATAMRRQMATALAVGFVAEDDAESRRLAADARDVVADLSSRQGADRDRAYLRAQVKAHTDARDRIANVLFPAAASDDWRGELAVARESVERHLARATALLGEAGAR